MERQSGHGLDFCQIDLMVDSGLKMNKYVAKAWTEEGQW